MQFIVTHEDASKQEGRTTDNSRRNLSSAKARRRADGSQISSRESAQGSLGASEPGVLLVQDRTGNAGAYKDSRYINRLEYVKILHRTAVFTDLRSKFC